VDVIAVKTCPCGISYSQQEWDRLDFVGLQSDDVETIVLRNCRCGSTIGIRWTPTPRIVEQIAFDYRIPERIQ
jgi:hypothetical protein